MKKWIFAALPTMVIFLLACDPGNDVSESEDLEETKCEVTVSSNSVTVDLHIPGYMSGWMIAADKGDYLSVSYETHYESKIEQENACKEAKESSRKYPPLQVDCMPDGIYGSLKDSVDLDWYVDEFEDVCDEYLDF